MLHGSPWLWALHLFEEMRQHLRLDIVSESSLVAISPWRPALQLHQEMRALQMRGNRVSELSLALTCRAQWPRSLLISKTFVVHWQQALQARRPRPTTKSLAELSGSEWKKALSILEEMRCWSRADLIGLSAISKL